MFEYFLNVEIFYLCLEGKYGSQKSCSDLTGAQTPGEHERMAVEREVAICARGCASFSDPRQSLRLWSRLAAPGTARYLAGFFNQSGFTNISDCHRKLDPNSCPLVMIGSQDTQIIKLRQQTICNA